MGCLILLLAVLILSLVFMTVNHMKKQVNSFDRTRIEISQVQDGVYEGKSETDLVKVEVRVTVSNGEITNIDLLKHECGLGKPAEEMIPTMIQKNDVEVDAITSATYSSEVIKDAIRNALRNGIEYVEPGNAQPTQIEEDKPKETIKEETTSFSGEDDIDDYINENLVLEDDEEIESCEWVCGDFQSDRCFRVRICYKEEPENEYKHKRDFFVFRERAGLTSIMVDYPSVRDYDAPRHVNEANNFDAVLEDVNIDEYEDLLISLGKTHNGEPVWCAYLYYRGTYVYNESFEKIINYRCDLAGEVIYSSFNSQGISFETIYKYDAAKEEFTEIYSYEEKDGEVFSVIADLIMYENTDFTENEMDWKIVSTLGEQGDSASGTLVSKDGQEIYYYGKMPIEDVEYFYKEVYGKDRTFEDGHEGTTEVGIFCQDDGYAYAHNGIGWGYYPAITNVEKTSDGIKVYCDVINAFDFLYVATFDFTLTESDNKYGYSLKKDSVHFIYNAPALWEAFKEAERIKLSEEDFTFEYDDNTFGISSKWRDFADILGYPDEHEENNYGYVTTDNAGYRWSMRYPSQSESDYDFQVVMVSPSMEREGEDTYIESIELMQTETYRGIKAGDSVSDLAAAYGRPNCITVHKGNDEWSDITYTYNQYVIGFVIADGKILFVEMYS